MTKEQKAAYDRSCYALPAWRRRKLAQNRAYRQSPAGKAKSVAYEQLRRASRRDQSSQDQLAPAKEIIR